MYDWGNDFSYAINLGFSFLPGLRIINPMSYDSISGSADIMQTVKDFAGAYSLWILGLAVVLILVLVYKMVYAPAKTEGMYQPGATAWLTDSIARMENFNIPTADQCSSIDTNQLNLSGSDAYRAWLATKMSSGTDSSFEYAYDPDKPEAMTDNSLMMQLYN